ncbi:hypothetical protein OS493_010809 [Desmophyllum pertusum]|uniref:Uncharacterized protein n=1 Tax=Desmophyllum pertusum TaxID=174260 RepID=A0A9X0D0A3_9CNID|nr:hypothetical protein OS493_010809 [Desmophyllum pertusum]
MTIQLEGENYEVFERQCSQLRLEEYSHVFIDELWFGKQIRYQMQEDNTINVVDELKIVKQAIDSIKGYVWMSSVFDFKEQCFEEISDEEIRQVLASRDWKITAPCTLSEIFLMAQKTCSITMWKDKTSAGLLSCHKATWTLRRST